MKHIIMEEYYHKHRERLRKIIMQSHGDVPKYQLLELLLTFILPRIDTKPLAKELLNSFDSFHKIFNAEIEHLTSIKGVGKQTAIFLKSIYQVLLVLQKEDLGKNKNFDMSVEQLSQYAMLKIGHDIKEKLLVFLFDSKKNLIKEYFHSTGTLSYNAIYIRELLKEILMFQTSYVVLCHNHPSKDHTPSIEDIKTTRKLSSLLRDLQIILYDHIIVSSNGYSSMRNLQLVF